MTDVVALILILFCAVRGYFKGLIGAITGVLGPIAGYAAVLLFGRALGAWIAQQGLLSPLFAYPVASISLFFSIQITVAGLSYLAHNWLEQRAQQAQGRISGLYWFAGGGVGALTGFAIAVIVVWAVTFAQAVLAHVGKGPAPAERTLSQRICGKVLGRAAAWTIRVRGDEDSRLARSLEVLVADPQQGLKRILAQLNGGGGAMRALSQADPEQLRRAMTTVEDLGEDGASLGSIRQLGQTSDKLLEQVNDLPKEQKRQVLENPLVKELIEKTDADAADSKELQKLLKNYQ